MKSVVVIDTSILCTWLGVPGKETCGPRDDRWDHARVVQFLLDAERQGATLVLPLATLIETGNHIAQGARDRHAKAKDLAKLLESAADGASPWAAFTQQADLWSAAALKKLAATWPERAAQRLSIGDTTIEDVARLYEEMGCRVEILTGDAGLKAREPFQPVVPRRRR